MNNFHHFLQKLSEAAEKRIQVAKSNRSKGIPDPLNDITDYYIQRIIEDRTIKEKTSNEKHLPRPQDR
jgi:hypothetical protein